MCLKKKWIMIIILAASIILVIGAVGGVAYAQSTATPTVTSPEKSMADRVAAILGLDQAKVEAAFIQAQKDIQKEALANRLKSMVSEGILTQDQADKYQQWIQSMPDVPAGLGLEGNLGFPGGAHGPGGPGGEGSGLNPPVATSTPKS